jgi:pyruvate/2-oxoglutarate dehydrogenase complex dihydrolipoamide acyltransferase (E2) component
VAQVQVRAPEFDDSECAGHLLFWYKQEGEAVQRGEPLAEVETAKAVLTVNAPVTGTLARILVPEDGDVSSWMPLGIIERR